MRTYLEVLWRWRRLYAVILPFSFLLGVVLAFTLPKQYRAQAVLLPPRESGLDTLSEQEIARLRASSPDPGPLEVIESPSGQAARLVHSRPVLEMACRALSPEGGWSSGEEREALELLGRSVRAWVTDELLIVIRAETTDPETAARLANAAGDGLISWYTERAIRRAGEAFDRTEDQLVTLEEELGALQDSLSHASVESLLEKAGVEGRRARRVKALTDMLIDLESEAARLRLLEADPPPPLEFLERAQVPVNAARPLKAAVIGLLLLSGFLGSTVVAFAGDLFRGGAPEVSSRSRPSDA